MLFHMLFMPKYAEIYASILDISLLFMIMSVGNILNNILLPYVFLSEIYLHYAGTFNIPTSYQWWVWER